MSDENFSCHSAGVLRRDSRPENRRIQRVERRCKASEEEKNEDGIFFSYVNIIQSARSDKSNSISVDERKRSSAPDGVRRNQNLLCVDAHTTLTELILFVIECHSALLLRRRHSLACFTLRGRRKASFSAGMINRHSKCNEIESSDTDPLSAHSPHHCIMLIVVVVAQDVEQSVGIVPGNATTMPRHPTQNKPTGFSCRCFVKRVEHSRTSTSITFQCIANRKTLSLCSLLVHCFTKWKIHYFASAMKNEKARSSR